MAITDALRFLPVTSCVLDGEAVTHTADGWPDFYGLRSADGGARAVLFAFDILNVEGVDMRGRPLTERRSTLRPSGPNDSERLSAWK